MQPIRRSLRTSLGRRRRRQRVVMRTAIVWTVQVTGAREATVEQVRRTRTQPHAHLALLIQEAQRRRGRQMQVRGRQQLVAGAKEGTRERLLQLGTYINTDTWEAQVRAIRELALAQDGKSPRRACRYQVLRRRRGDEENRTKRLSGRGRSRMKRGDNSKNVIS